MINKRLRDQLMICSLPALRYQCEGLGLATMRFFTSGEQMCQPLGQNTAKIDLSSSPNSTSKPTPQSYKTNMLSIFGLTK